ncbi:MAG TPA: helix-turn-helix domain-containing protein [Anaeromyxobacteraceae bacterium]|nr:helix-turn-helix domain-containing protein [Anaeromyxobacteraceae bacterium]
MDVFLSTRDVARLAGVGPTAVKRWADEGLIRCVRTAGGHRRFDRADVERFLRHRSPEEAADLAEDRWVETLLKQGEPLEVEAMLLAGRSKKGSWHRVADAAGAALGMLGRLWQQGSVTVLQEHLASERLSRALARVSQAIPIAPDAPRALLACAEGDDHSLGLALAELVLREAGWATLWAGRGTPVAEVGFGLSGSEVRLLAVSASEASSDAAALRAQADALGKACRQAGAALAVGGGGAWPDHLSYGMRFRSLETFFHFAVEERARLRERGAA